MKIKEEQLANYEECYNNRIKMETREKQGEQGKKNTKDTTKCSQYNGFVWIELIVAETEN